MTNNNKKYVCPNCGNNTFFVEEVNCPSKDNYDTWCEYNPICTKCGTSDYQYDRKEYFND